LSDKVSICRVFLFNISDLKKIKWEADGGKSPVDLQANLTNAIENLPSTPEIATKFGFETIQRLESEIIDRFDDIFILVD
jgi:hypothetical protein